MLGARRNPDVMIERLRAVEGRLTQEDRPGIESLIDALHSHQDEANRRLTEELSKVREDRLRERLRLLAAEVRA